MNKPFNDDPVEVLVKKFLTKDGTVLDLRLKYIGDEGLEYLSQCPDLIDLEILNLERNEVTDKGIQALAKSSIITNLKELHLERNDDRRCWSQSHCHISKLFLSALHQFLEK